MPEPPAKKQGHGHECEEPGNRSRYSRSDLDDRFIDFRLNLLLNLCLNEPKSKLDPEALTA